MKQSEDTSFNSNIPRVTSLSGYLLQARGWVREKSVYKKDGIELSYDGCDWITNDGRKIKFYEDIKPKTDANNHSE
jgi:hypothetical protein